MQSGCSALGPFGRIEHQPLRGLHECTSTRAVPRIARRACNSHTMSHDVMARAQPGAVVREVLRRPDRTKLDESDDRQFYSMPRLVKHVDDRFLAQVTQLYRERIPPGGSVLDLCSSWVSHLPDEVPYARVVGHGMNAAELARNPRLDTFFVRNLNTEPRGWAATDNSFDAVLCCVSVQYLQQPEEVFSEIHRVLKPGGVCIVTFSNRMFPHKAISAWTQADSGYARCQLVKSYFMAVEGFGPPQALTQVALPNESAPLSARLPGPLASVAKLFERSASDPFYAVLAHKL
ncbi:S-adenosyl-L-methionine-dependent methyltransferase [Haematococcus lacustris]